MDLGQGSSCCSQLLNVMAYFSSLMDSSLDFDWIYLDFAKPLMVYHIQIIFQVITDWY